MYDPNDPLADVLYHPYENDGINHIFVKDTGKSYELYKGQWVESYDGDLADIEHDRRRDEREVHSRP